LVEEERDLLFEAFEGKIPSSLSDLYQLFETSTQKGPEDLRSYHQMLDASFQSIPDASDSERPKQYLPKTPFPTPAYYPQVPFGQFENPAAFEKFDTDTLFFIFYHQQGTYQQ